MSKSEYTTRNLLGRIGELSSFDLDDLLRGAPISITVISVLPLITGNDRGNGDDIPLAFSVSPSSPPSAPASCPARPEKPGRPRWTLRQPPRPRLRRLQPGGDPGSASFAGRKPEALQKPSCHLWRPATPV